MWNQFSAAALAVLLVAGSIHGQELDSRMTERRTPSGREGEIVRRTISPSVITLYDALSDLFVADQRDVLRTIVPQVKVDLWRYNMYVFLDRHPNLTEAQLDLIRKNLAYIGLPHVFDDYNGTTLDRERKKHAGQELDTAYAASGFSPELYVTAFEHLGPTAPRRIIGSRSVEATGAKPSPNTYPDCECTIHEGCFQYMMTFCDAGTTCYPVTGCGWDGSRACIGVCVPNAP